MQRLLGTLVVTALVVAAGACSDEGGPPPDSGPPPDAAGDLGGRREAGADGLPADAGPDGPKRPARWGTVPGISPSGIGLTATLLNDGRVLVAGGYRKDPQEKTLADTFLYLPNKRTFVQAGKLKQGRCYHTATRLSDGRVLVVGGDDASSKQLATTEIFDPTKPAASAWSQGPSLAAPRRSHAAVLLKSGEVLVVGGYSASAGYLASIAIYMPSANNWKIPSAKMSTVRHIPAAIRLTSGKVLIVGGILTTSSESDTLEVYDPSSGTFATAKDKLSYPKYRPSLSLLSDGRVLIVGGVGYGSNKSDEIYDPIANSIKKITHPGGPPEEHAAATLKDGKVLVCGGNLSANHNKALIYDPDQGGSWMPQPELNIGRQRHRAVTLKDGSVLVVGGRKHQVEAYINVAEIFYP